MTELCAMTASWGLRSRKDKPLKLQTVAGILSNPFYCGLMRIKGHLYPHNYPQLVAVNIFHECERRKRNPQQAIKITRYPFILRGLMSCATSGRKVTCSLQKGRYVYLMPRDPHDKDKVVWVKEETVLKQLGDVLKSFAMPPELLTEILAYIKDSHEAEKEFHHARLHDLQLEKNTLTTKLDRLTDLLVDRHIEEAVYAKKQAEINFRLREINCISGETDDANLDYKDALCKVLTLVARSYDLFASSNTEEKRSMLGFVFSNLQLEGPTLRYTLRKPFDIFAQLPHNPEWRARQDSNL